MTNNILVKRPVRHPCLSLRAFHTVKLRHVMDGHSRACIWEFFIFDLTLFGNFLKSESANEAAGSRVPIEIAEMR
ncbi:hypothetical protein LMH66_14685 [Shewanella sp. 10N.7]|uniref:hypothetical protein n=1 Tax=Shewanella sp. 10N.7 TaxID=2885093 RepID=UPI001E3A3B70|nr:hypothetical protein [Shewanella sp. 10N.7]MCC4833888.1 hypothetical protein [Shewanella sp. 10N.7]